MLILESNKINLRNLIIDVLKKLFEVGLCPKVIVCDQGTNNQSTLKSLNISEANPYFYIDNNKFFSLFSLYIDSFIFHVSGVNNSTLISETLSSFVL